MKTTNNISYRVMKWHEFKGQFPGVWYQFACDCGSQEHNALIELEFDENGLIWLHFYKNLAASVYWQDGGKWYKNIWLRIKFAFKILYHGYIELSEELVIQGEDHISSLIHALEEGRNKIYKYMVK